MNRNSVIARMFRGVALFSLALIGPAALAAQGFPATEYQARREAIMKKVPDGILLIHANTSLFSIDGISSNGFHQDPTFYYFTGLPNALSAILAIDGRKKESWLFVPTKLNGLADLIRTPFVESGTKSQSQLLINHVVKWEEFVGYVDGELKKDPSLTLYTEDVTPSIMTTPPPLSNPPGLAPIDDRLLLWKTAIATRWPQAKVRSASDSILAMQLVKTPAEIEQMRVVGHLSAGAVTTALHTIRPGVTQNAVDAEIARGCVLQGGEGPSFYPMILAGPNSAFPELLEGPVDYYRHDRVMQAGEVVHLDTGCEKDLYGGDVGRTVPVSGKFTDGQREVWNLLVEAYRAGLASMGEGVTREQVFAAALAKARSLQPTLHTDLGKKAAGIVLGKDGTEDWYLHSSGLGAATTSPPTLHAGMIVVFEPYINLAGQGYYLEDMTLVKSHGSEVLTSGLPYTPDEIESAMAEKPH
jgi:Xaa-Pro aminopeptidase